MAPSRFLYRRVVAVTRIKDPIGILAWLHLAVSCDPHMPKAAKLQAYAHLQHAIKYLISTEKGAYSNLAEATKAVPLVKPRRPKS